MTGPRGRRAGIAALLFVAVIATPGAVLAARAWTLVRSPADIQAAVQTAITLTAQNVGGNGGGDEITCVAVDIPASFSVSSFAVVSVKGVTSAATHGWQAYSSSSGGTTRIAFKNPSDKNPLVGLPTGDSAVFQISGTASTAGTLSWTATAFDKPGSAGTTKCGSGQFNTIGLSFTVSGYSTPAPTPAPTPRPTATPAPTRAPTPAPVAIPKRTPTPRPAGVPSPTVPVAPTPFATLAPAAGAPGVPSTSPVPSATPSADSRAVEPITVGPPDRGNGSGREVGGLGGAVTSAFLSLGLATWSVPAAALGVPGLLLLLVVALQSIGAAAWLPIARRWLSRATPRPAASAEPDRAAES